MPTDKTLLLGLGAGIALLSAALLLRQKSKLKTQYTNLPTIAWEELLDTENRRHHPAFNRRLLRDYPDAEFIEAVPNHEGSPVLIVHKYKTAVDVIADHQSFTSNPWPDERPLVTLNTMDKVDHDRLYRIIRPFYTPAAVAVLTPTIRDIVSEHGMRFRADGDAFKFTKRLHMHVSLVSSGLFPNVTVDDPLIDRFIRWNDATVRLVAPLGGVGRYPRRTLGAVYRLLRGVAGSFPSFLALVRRIGFRETMMLLNPLEVIWPSFPYTQVWEFPELLKDIPTYFAEIYDLMKSAHPESAAGALYNAIGQTISHAEALGTAVQLMVNMTAANGLMSLIYRRCLNQSTGIDDILVEDPALQRNPRRAVKDAYIGGVYVPKGSLVLLMMGAANIDRPPESMALTFAFGLHHCLGRHLMRLELDIVNDWLAHECADLPLTLVEMPQRLVDVDVGNWGFVQLKVAFP